MFVVLLTARVASAAVGTPPPVACSHQVTGPLVDTATLAQTPCPKIAAAAASAAPTGPIEVFGIDYLDDSLPYFSGGSLVLTVPTSPTYSSDQAFRWLFRLYGLQRPAAWGGPQIIEASVGYGHWPGVDGTTNGTWSVWTSVQSGNQLFYQTPVRVQAGDVLTLGTTLAYVNALDSTEPPEQALYEQSTVLEWDTTVKRNGQALIDSWWTTSSLWFLDFDATVFVMAMNNVPGVNIPSCGLSMAPSGSLLAGPILLTTSAPTDPLVPLPIVQVLAHYSNVQGVPNTCGWSQDNALPVDSQDVLFTWPTGLQQAPPAAVPAASALVVLALGFSLAICGLALLRTRAS